MKYQMFAEKANGQLVNHEYDDLKDVKRYYKLTKTNTSKMGRKLQPRIRYEKETDTYCIFLFLRTRGNSVVSFTPGYQECEVKDAYWHTYISCTMASPHKYRVGMIRV
mgnify:CR=1 FL=1